MQFEQGPGFALPAGRDVPGAELLLDASCALEEEADARRDP